MRGARSLYHTLYLRCTQHLLKWMSSNHHVLVSGKRVIKQAFHLSFSICKYQIWNLPNLINQFREYQFQKREGDVTKLIWAHTAVQSLRNTLSGGRKLLDTFLERQCFKATSTRTFQIDTQNCNRHRNWSGRHPYASIWGIQNAEYESETRCGAFWQAKSNFITLCSVLRAI